MCDCAEELERRERAEADELNNAMAALRVESDPPSIFRRLIDFLAGSGGSSGGSSKFIGGAALLIGLLGFLYKNFGEKFNLRAPFGGFSLKGPFGGTKKKADPCEGTSTVVKKPVPPEKPIVPCECR
ncbi:uncharacterized protein [Epargyreus clarus]|uniref:uncharacterized protein n=1 Tax=Epargyreus clarus TaxID=520877 RepID=UPI003C2AB2C8